MASTLSDQLHEPSPELLQELQQELDRINRAQDESLVWYETAACSVDEQLEELYFDLAAVRPLQGAPCVGCQLERARVDLGNPDGLCTDCRDSRPAR